MLVACRDAALTLQPGAIESLTTQVRHGVYYYVFSIRAADRVQHQVICDAGTGKAEKAPGKGAS